VTRLRSSDLRGIVAFVGEMNELDGDEPFPSELLGRLVGLVPADGAFFTERDERRHTLVACSEWWGDDATNGDGAESDQDPGGEACQYGLHHPANVYRHRTGYMGALADSDFYGRSARLRHDLFAPDYHAFLGIVDAISVCVARSSTHTGTLWFESGDRDFSERDKLVLDALRPHLETRRRQVCLRLLLASALAALETTRGDADGSGAAVVLVDSSGRVEFSSPAARRFLDEYFGESGRSLPPLLEDWRGAESHSPFTVRRDGYRLVVNAVGPARSALLLHEELASAPSLTAREWHVMGWVEAGKTNDEIARLLWITPGTVKKHLEHVYAKLGVRTRTAAVAKLRPRHAASTENHSESSAAV
jgi:DNA-binding CsgD family transcriptional regulator